MWLLVLLISFLHAFSLPSIQNSPSYKWYLSLPQDSPTRADCSVVRLGPGAPIIPGHTSVLELPPHHQTRIRNSLSYSMHSSTQWNPLIVTWMEDSDISKDESVVLSYAALCDILDHSSLDDEKNGKKLPIRVIARLEILEFEDPLPSGSLFVKVRPLKDIRRGKLQNPSVSKNNMQLVYQLYGRWQRLTEKLEDLKTKTESSSTFVRQLESISKIRDNKNVIQIDKSKSVDDIETTFTELVNLLPAPPTDEEACELLSFAAIVRPLTFEHHLWAFKQIDSEMRLDVACQVLAAEIRKLEERVSGLLRVVVHLPNPHLSLWHLPGSFVTIVSCLAAFLACSLSDPGVVRESNVNEWVKIYPYDGKMFIEGRSCSTCKLLKPARSKHCSFCNRCVAKFDHHCIWIANCVGAKNFGKFICFLAFHTFLFSYGCFLVFKTIIAIADHRRLASAVFVESETGRREKATLKLIAMYFLHHHTLLCALGTVCTLFMLVLGGFTFFNFYLGIGCNETANESHKAWNLGLDYKGESTAIVSYNKGWRSNWNEAWNWDRWAKGVLKKL